MTAPRIAPVGPKLNHKCPYRTASQIITQKRGGHGIEEAEGGVTRRQALKGQTPERHRTDCPPEPTPWFCPRDTGVEPVPSRTVTESISFAVSDQIYPPHFRGRTSRGLWEPRARSPQGNSAELVKITFLSQPFKALGSGSKGAQQRRNFHP